MNTTRPYSQTRRQRDTEARRGRILDAAEDLLNQRVAHEISVDEIAEKADVARATVFTQFGSKAGLLTALVDRMSKRGGAVQLGTALDDPNPVAALQAMFEIGTGLWRSESSLYTALIAHAAVDPVVADALARKDAGRRHAVQKIVGRLADAGQLSDGVSLAEAERLLCLITSYETHVQLATGARGPKAIVSGLRHLSVGLVPALAPLRSPTNDNRRQK
jgi:AcrR family transcriptional regulator